MEKSVLNHIRSQQVKLKVNSILDNYDEISNVLNKNQIAFETFKSNIDEYPESICLGFGTGCDFFDTYSVAYIFEKYGLEFIYPLHSEANVIYIGTNFYERHHKVRYLYAKSEPIYIEEFFQINPYLKLDEVISNHFWLSLDPEEKYDKDDNLFNDNELLWDALTDGMYGNYDDSDADADDASSVMGRD